MRLLLIILLFFPALAHAERDARCFTGCVEDGLQGHVCNMVCDVNPEVGLPRKIAPMQYACFNQCIAKQGTVLGCAYQCRREQHVKKLERIEQSIKEAEQVEAEKVHKLKQAVEAEKQVPPEQAERVEKTLKTLKLDEESRQLRDARAEIRVEETLETLKLMPKEEPVKEPVIIP